MDLENTLYKYYTKFRLLYFKKISKRFLFEVQVADHCNLNCVGCSHFSSIADEHFLDVANYKKDCEKLSELAKKYVRKIHLLGGEPLLHKNIVDIIEITRTNFEKSVIKIITNGILLDRMEPAFWNSCKKNNVVICITQYPININIKKICECSLQYGVDIERFGNDFTMKFRKDVYDADGLQNKKKSFKTCNPICHQLHDGKLYLCPATAYIKYLNKYFSKNFVVSEKDYVDIYQVKNIKTLVKFLRNPIPFCRYCNKNASERNIIWHISKREISEWM
jgi:MoaA/NifB/PqqE/SkfB family radical SAM enzyme